MKTNNIVSIITLLALAGGLIQAAPMGTAFTFQGELTDEASPPADRYDLTFTLFDAKTGGAVVAGPITNSLVSVTNGAFTVLLDFGPGVFTGEARWLELAARTNESSAFIPLSPRQSLTPAPYALYASSAGVAATATTASSAAAVAPNGVANASLQSNAVTTDKIADGTITTNDLGNAVLSSTFWRLGGNVGVTADSHFLGTTDSQPLELRVNNQRGLRLEPGGSNSVNVVAGSSVNSITAGVLGATISGGGAGFYFGDSQTNRVNADFGTIGGGLRNTILPLANEATIAGGRANTVEEDAVGGTIVGGRGNSIGFNADWSSIGGGTYNQVQSNAWYATIGGGSVNSASGGYSTVPGGTGNSAAGGYSLAAGRRAKANHIGALVWADSTDADFASTANNQFSVRAGGGVRFETGGAGVTVDGQPLLAGGRLGVGTTSPLMPLHVAGSGSPASLLVGERHDSGGYTALFQGVSAVSGGYSYLQAVKSAGISWGSLVLNPNGGNVGINTTTPQSALQVAGTVTATSFAGRGVLPWQEETNFTSSRLMEPNRGYLANSGSRISFTLPSSPAVGDIVRVSGGGEGGWTVAQNAGQSVLLKELGVPGSVWVPRESNRIWNAVASSADGSKLVAAVYDGEIYTSTNAGVTWTARGITKSWTGVASSDNGVRLAAVVMGGTIYVSANSGATWTERGFPAQWTSIASSADGTKLVATGWNTRLYTSADSGVFWYGYGFTNRWNTVVSSTDGTRMFAAAEISGLPGYAPGVYASTSSGQSWELRSDDNLTLTVAAGADGQTVAYASADLFTSMNNGLTWHAHPTVGRFRHLASSADGRVLLAANSNSQLSISTDYGATWVRREAVRNWMGVACSADGTKFVAVAQGGQIYTSSATTTPGPGGALSGEQGAVIELQYVGGGRWMPLSSQGTINAF